MKKHLHIIIISLAFLLTLSVCGIAVFADDTTVADLPVSESYVLRVLGLLEERINAKIDSLTSALTVLSEKVDALPADTAGQTSPETTAPAETTSPITDPVSDFMTFEVLCLSKGQTVTGACELILRSGTANALCPGVNGLSDLTAGADLSDGTQIDANHLILVPRDDGRGFTVTSDTAYIMVRGSHTVK